MCGGVCYHDKTKAPERNDLKLGTAVDIDTVSKPIDFGYKRSRVRVRVRVTTVKQSAPICSAYAF